MNENEVEMQIRGMTIDHTPCGDIIGVVLQEKNGKRILQMFVDPYLATMIKLAIDNEVLPRPSTHDLAKNILLTLGAEMEKVVINQIKGDIFFALIHLRTRDGRIITVDSRPSDGMALGLRCNCPILVDNEVLEEAGFTPDRDLDDISLESLPSGSWEM